MKPTPLMVSALIAAGLVALPPLLHAQDAARGRARRVLHARRQGLPHARRQSRQPGLLVADADQPGEHQEAGAGMANARVAPSAPAEPDGHAASRPRRSWSTASSTSTRPAAASSPSTARRARPSGSGRRRRSAPTARAAASRSVTARSTRWPTAIASSRSTRTRERRSGSYSPRPRRRLARQHREGRHRLSRRHGVRGHQRRQPQCSVRLEIERRQHGLVVLWRRGALERWSPT